MGWYSWGINPRAQTAAAFHSGQEAPLSCTVFPDAKLLGGSYKGFTAALLPDNSMSVLGGGVNGAMGNGGHRASYYLPVKPSIIVPFSGFDCGGAHVLAVTADGRPVTWGGNSWGTLGNGTWGEGLEQSGTATPYVIPGISDVIAVSTSNGIAAALHATGEVSTWGTGTGLGRPVTKTPSDWRPGKVPGLTGVKAIATGGFGSNNHVIALLGNGTVVQWGSKGGCGTTKDLAGPTSVPGLSNIVGVAAGPAQSFAWDAAGNLWVWGTNNLQQLFLPAEVKVQPTPTLIATNAAMAACGFQFSLMLSKEGTIAGAGRNDASQLPPPGSLSYIDWIGCGEQHSFAQGHGAPITPPITTKPLGGGKVEVNWIAPRGEKQQWEVSSHVLSTVQGKVTKYPVETRKATITTEPGKQTEVKVRNGTTFARYAIVVAT